MALKRSKKLSKTPKEVRYITTLETFYKPVEGELERFKKGTVIDLSNSRYISVDIETEGLDRYKDEIKTVQITDEEYNTWVIFIDGNYENLKNLCRFLNQFRIITHGGKFDSLFFYVKCGLRLKLYGDTLILAHMMTEPSLKLKDLVQKYYDDKYDIDTKTKKSDYKVTLASLKKGLKEANPPKTVLTVYNKALTQLHEQLGSIVRIEDYKAFMTYVDKYFVDGKLSNKLVDYYRKVTKRVILQERRALIEYGIKDTIYTLKLFRYFRKKIKSYNLSNVYRHELRAYKAYIEVEKEGVTLDWGLLVESKEELEETIYDTLQALNNLKSVKKYGENINWNSTQQLVKFYVDYLGLKADKTTAGGAPQVNSAQLVEWNKQGKHESLPILLDYKVAVKQLQFITKWEELAESDGKIHPSFNITADTGRTTCNSPNLQQVPQASKLRNIITASKGRKILEVDMSQAELRVASMFADDENMIGAYLAGSDLHTSTMNFLYAGKTPKDEQQAKAWRTDAKATNFGFLYGMQAKTFVDYAKGYGMEITEEEAEEFRDNFFESYPNLLDMHDNFVLYARKYGYTYSPIGRKRFLPNIKSRNFKLSSEAERQAINTPVQGFASDMVISALADIIHDKTMDKKKYKILGSIHDAILMEVDTDVIEEYAQKVKAHMENPSVLDICEMELKVPMVADIEIGSAWGKHD